MAECAADSSSESGSEWEEGPTEDGPPCLCLFCGDEVSGGQAATLEHCAAVHKVSLVDLMSRLDLDFYSRIKFINYIRKERPSASSVLAAAPPFPWSPDSYLSPVLPDDPLLCMDFEPSEEEEGTEQSSSTSGETTETSEASLRVKLDEANVIVSQYQDALSQARQDLEDMRHAVRGLVGDVDDQEIDHAHLKGVSNKWGEEEGYFGSYTHYKIHEDMLKDEVRTETYKFFFEKNVAMFKDKVVLDIGCGTGILSMFAAAAGAKLVIGVDHSNIVYKAMDIVRENGFESRVTLLKGKVEEVTLPVEEVDIIVSEWMGYFLLYESMLDTVLFARDKWLKNKSYVFPNSCSLSIVALGNQFEWESKVDYWTNVYGFKMNCMREDVLREPSIQVVDHHATISSSDTIKKFDLSKVSVAELDFEAPFSLTMQHDTKCHALVGYFDVEFSNIDYPLYLCTGPQEVPTHWKQTVFFLRNPITVSTGDLMKGTLSCRKHKADPRSLDIHIQFEVDSFSKTETVKVSQTFVLE